MDEDFTKKAVIPGDPNYVWDKVEEFHGLQRQPSGWDDDDDDGDSTHFLGSKVLDKQAEPTSPAVEAKVLEEDSFVQLEEVVVIPSRDPSPVNLKEEEQVLDKVEVNDDANGDDAKHPFDLLLETSQFQEDAYSDEDDFWK
jgi:hypothetical protein